MRNYNNISKIIRNGIKKALTTISPKLETYINYRVVFGEWIDKKNPQDINAKINLLKINDYYKNPAVTMCVDKYKVREYLAQKGYENLSAHVYGIYDSIEDIDWSKLPQAFAIKCNHGSGYNIIVKDKNLLDIEDAKKKIMSWMKENYWAMGEVQYKYVRKKIIVEEYLGAGEQLKTIKFYCFNGEPRVAYVSIGEEQYYDYYDMQFNHLPYTLFGHKHYPKKIEKPTTYDKMISIARDLSKDFPFVRVDLYDKEGAIYFSEFTFIPTAGYMKIEPREVLKQWGEWLKMPN